ncbi:MAG: DUF1295 domain-containing protein [Rhodobacteraceae bacterium]|nr:DUF1295 domain-containing protein [Paracoccaceae bacterium]
MSLQTFNWLILCWALLAVALVPVQLWLTPGYGRHASGKWGPGIDNRLGWIVMEIVSPVALLAPFAAGGAVSAPVAVFLGLWLAHYLQRSVIYPLTMRTRGKKIPLVIVASAILFNTANGWANGYYLAQGWGGYGGQWLADPRFWIGLAVFALGATINIRADRRLVALRDHGEPQTYVIPKGGLFRWVSCPNHLGEIVEWTGFAIACWNLPALAFAVWTAANLAPRAIAHHRWYRQTFPDYPSERKALIPFLL